MRKFLGVPVLLPFQSTVAVIKTYRTSQYEQSFHAPSGISESGGTVIAISPTVRIPAFTGTVTAISPRRGTTRRYDEAIRRCVIRASEEGDKAAMSIKTVKTVRIVKLVKPVVTDEDTEEYPNCYGGKKRGAWK